MDQADDLKAFERRMIEIVSSLQPSIWRWRLILFTLILISSFTLYSLISNRWFSPSTSATPAPTNVDLENRSYMSIFSSSFYRKEIYFTISLTLLISAFLFGIHRKIFASSIITSRFRYVLTDYNMSCDVNGRLIIKPRPTTIF